jgi:hypothetical protein
MLLADDERCPNVTRDALRSAAHLAAHAVDADAQPFMVDAI